MEELRDYDRYYEKLDSGEKTRVMGRVITLCHIRFEGMTEEAAKIATEEEIYGKCEGDDGKIDSMFEQMQKLIEEKYEAEYGWRISGLYLEAIDAHYGWKNGVLKTF